MKKKRSPAKTETDFDPAINMDMDMDMARGIDPDPNPDQTAAAQIQEELRKDFARTLRSRRPLLTHLNADTSWLLSVAKPQGKLSGSAKGGTRGRGSGKDEKGREKGNGRRKVKGKGSGVEMGAVGEEALTGGDDEYENGNGNWNGTGSGSGNDQVNGKVRDLPQNYFHILIDPWLQGSQSDVAAFFSTQWHATESAVQTIAEVEAVVGGIERASAEPTSTRASNANPPPPSPTKGQIDAIVISHEFTDHMHQATLLTAPASIPVLAVSKAASIIRSWGHFETVVTMPSFTKAMAEKSGGWRTASVSPLPPWLTIARLATEGLDLLYYHSAVMIAFPLERRRDQDEKDVDDEEDDADADADAEGAAEAVIYTPHGIPTTDLEPFIASKPRIQALALLHGAHDVQLGRGGQLNLGAHNGLKAQRVLGARYWVGTHDEVKRGGGLVSYFLKRKIVSLEEALELERMGNAEGKGNGIGEREAGRVLDEVSFVELLNGESLVLE